MTAPTYTAIGSTVFMEEHVPLTMERAHEILRIHRSNRDRWLLRDDLSDAAVLQAASVEQSLADEMAEAIRAATQPEQKEAA